MNTYLLVEMSSTMMYPSFRVIDAVKSETKEKATTVLGGSQQYHTGTLVVLEEDYIKGVMHLKERFESPEKKTS